MSFGADAILDVMAPVRAPAEPAAAGDDQNSFDDHLNEATNDLRESDARAERPRDAQDAEAEPPAEPQIVAVAPQAPPTPTAALLQIYASLTGQAASEQQTAPTPVVAPAPVSDTAPTLPAQQASAEVQPTTSGSKTDPSPAADATLSPSAGAALRVDAPVADAPAPPPPASATPAQDQVSPQPVQTAAVPATPPPEAAVLAVPIVMPAPPAAQSMQSIKSGDKADLAIDAQKPIDAKSLPTQDNKIPAPAPRADSAAPQSVQPQSTPKSNANAAKAVAAETAPAAPSASAQPSASQSAPLPPAAPLAEAAPIESAHRTAPASHQIGREIIRRFNGESTRFEMRLDPPELGRVDVRLEVSRDHKVTAVIAADNPQALAELSRHARDLEQALNSAGLDLAEDGLSFDLSDHRGAEARGEESKSGAGVNTAEIAPEQVVSARPLGLERWRGVRVDVMA